MPLTKIKKCAIINQLREATRPSTSNKFSSQTISRLSMRHVPMSSDPSLLEKLIFALGTGAMLSKMGVEYGENRPRYFPLGFQLQAERLIVTLVGDVEFVIDLAVWSIWGAPNGKLFLRLDEALCSPIPGANIMTRFMINPIG